MSVYFFWKTIVLYFEYFWFYIHENIYPHTVTELTGMICTLYQRAIQRHRLTGKQFH